MKRENILKITRTAMLLALTVAIQTVFRMFLVGLPQIIVVGSLVNLILILSTVTCGFWGGFAVAVFAPIIAFFQGHIPPFIPMAAAVAIGNLAIVLIFAFNKPLKNKIENDFTRNLIMTVSGAVLKFVVLYIAVVKLVLPFVILKSALPDVKKAAMSALLTVNFSWPQLVTALIGGIVFTVLYPQIKKIISKTER